MIHIKLSDEWRSIIFLLTFFLLSASDTGESIPKPLYSIQKCYEHLTRVFRLPVTPHVCLSLLDENGYVNDSRAWRKIGALQEIGFLPGEKPPEKFECVPIKKAPLEEIMKNWSCITEVFDSCKEKYSYDWNCRHVVKFAEEKCL